MCCGRTVGTAQVHTPWMRGAQTFPTTARSRSEVEECAQCPIRALGGSPVTCSDVPDDGGCRRAAEGSRTDRSSRRCDVATRPGQRSYVRNYKGVIPPPLWRTLWITSCGGWTVGMCTPVRTHVSTESPPSSVDRHGAVHSARGIAARLCRGGECRRAGDSRSAPAAQRLGRSMLGAQCSAPASQCSAPPARRTSASVESATSTIRTSARAAAGESTTSAVGTWTNPPRIPSSAGSVASRCCSA